MFADCSQNNLGVPEAPAHVRHTPTKKPNRASHAMRPFWRNPQPNSSHPPQAKLVASKLQETSRLRCPRGFRSPLLPAARPFRRNRPVRRQRRYPPPSSDPDPRQQQHGPPRSSPPLPCCSSRRTPTRPPVDNSTRIQILSKQIMQWVQTLRNDPEQIATETKTLSAVLEENRIAPARETALPSRTMHWVTQHPKLRWS